MRPSIHAIFRTVTVMVLASGAASAQTTAGRAERRPSFAESLAGVPRGEEIIVTDTAGSTTRGLVAAVSDDAIEVAAGGGARRIAASGVVKVQWRQRDSWIDGALIGAAVGAAPGLYWLVADPNECTGMCPEDYALVAVGAAVGALIDRAIRRRVTVYSAGRPDAPARASVAPIVTEGRAGLRIVLAFQ